MDHRIALQFGGGNEISNLWTLCKPCHFSKTATERRNGQPDGRALAVEIPTDEPDPRSMIV
ncbi:HNH endonuclease signature motif containing protein [Enterobacter huaxiensis]|uniref:HNH endonuclease signature motif containing protein n=1 Tax=Enterobacter huaxiensis TaxID=2494702 RepID=UPI0035C128BE